MDRRHAERRWRLGRLRRQQSRILPQQHPVLRPRRLARSADRRRHGALHLDAGTARRDQGQSAGRYGHRVSAPHPASRGLVVRPLGHELHLRHLVGAVRAQRGRRQPPGSDDPQGGRLAGLGPESGWRLGRGRRQLSPRLQRPRARPQYRIANSMGPAGADGGGRGGKSRACPGCRVPNCNTDRKRAVGRATLYGNRLSSGVLPALPWISEVFSGLGAGAVSQLEEHQQQGGRGRDVNLGAGDYSSGGRVDPRPILIVTGLLQEARIAAGPGMAVVCSSSDPQQLRALLSVFDPETIRGVISFGVAGGLDPSLKSGDVVVATEVTSGDTRWLAGLSLNENLFAGVALGGRRIVKGSLAGAEALVEGQSCKAALRLETGAVAVDMESHIAAAYAA